MEARVVDRSDACEFSFERDQIGELELKSDALSQGYVDGEWGRVKSIVNKDGFYPTGDLVKLHEDGCVSFVRRVGMVVKL